MVRGIMFKLEFPYAHFGTRNCAGDLLFPIVWEAIRRLEAQHIPVICVTADGASPNRRFFRMHYDNWYSPDDRWLYFVSDPPHLMKTGHILGVMALGT